MLGLPHSDTPRPSALPRHELLYQWADRVASRFPELPRPTAFVLALWAFGMALAHACGLTAVALHLAPLLGQAVNALRQRLREFYKPAGAKAGRGRTALDPAACCAPLVRWVTSGWADRRVALALDVTNFGGRFHVLACAVAYRGCAVPVAWSVLPGGLAPALVRPAGPRGRGPGARLGGGGADRPRAGVGPAVPGHHGAGLAPADAGQGRRHVPAGWSRPCRLGAFAARQGRRFAAAGTAYAGERLPCTLLACWRPGCAEPWLLLTDLGPQAAAPCWYAWRGWVEQGFKVIKSGGWDWEATRITAPDRAERQWAALAVATLWLIEVGGLAELEPRPETLPPLPKPRAGRPRLYRLFRVGWALIVAGIASGRVPVGRFAPEAWPEPQPTPEISEHVFHSQMTYP